MDKQQFTTQLEKIENYFEKCKLVAHTIDNVLCSSGQNIVDFGYDIIDDHVSNIATLSGVPIEWLTSYLYDGKGDWYLNGVKWSVITPEDLWDFNEANNERGTNN